MCRHRESNYTMAVHGNRTSAQSSDPGRQPRCSPGLSSSRASWRLALARDSESSRTRARRGTVRAPPLVGVGDRSPAARSTSRAKQSARVRDLADQACGGRCLVAAASGMALPRIQNDRNPAPRQSRAGFLHACSMPTALVYGWIDTAVIVGSRAFPVTHPAVAWQTSCA